jgi:hypothetical protein
VSSALRTGASPSGASDEVPLGDATGARVAERILVIDGRGGFRVWDVIPV